jgi:hypothetical protein
MEPTQRLSASLVRACVATLGLVMLVALPTSAIEWTSVEGTARGYPVMRDLTGRRLADGDFTQWVANDRLHVRIAYAFDGGRHAEEEVVFRQRPQLAQESWSFRELQGKEPTRTFAIDFATGAATAAKRDEKGEIKHWSETIKVDGGQTFAGFGFTLAIKALRDRLVKGEVITLKGIGFTPKPQIASTEVSYAGRDRIRMAGRVIVAEHFVVHPKVPAIAKLFVKVPDAQIWMTTPPAGFLRWEGAMAEPSDQVIRVDMMPGATSEAATPVATSGTPK